MGPEGFMGEGGRFSNTTSYDCLSAIKSFNPLEPSLPALNNQVEHK